MGYIIFTIAKAVWVMQSFNRLKVPVIGIAKMIPLFFSTKMKPKHITDASLQNIMVNSLLNELISPNMSNLNSLYFYYMYFICHSCWNLLGKIIEGINCKHSPYLIIWHDSVDLVSCIVFLDLSGWKKCEKSPRHSKTWQVNHSNLCPQCVCTYFMHLMGICFIFFSFCNLHSINWMHN